MLVYVRACVWVCLRVREGVWVWVYVAGSNFVHMHTHARVLTHIVGGHVLQCGWIRLALCMHMRMAIKLEVDVLTDSSLDRQLT